MFTGIIEEIGILEEISNEGNASVLKINASKVLEGTNIGDSIAVNGICLTVVKIYANSFDADVMPGTIKRTNIKNLKKGDRVNLERAMAANGRFGGHVVSGHIDGIGRIVDIKKDNNAVWYTIESSKEILYYIVEKGSVALDGISLTVAYVDDKRFKVSIIPHTWSQTILCDKNIGDYINIENDIYGKYINKFYSEQQKESKKSNITLDFLRDNGF